MRLPKGRAHLALKPPYLFFWFSFVSFFFVLFFLTYKYENFSPEKVFLLIPFLFNFPCSLSFSVSLFFVFFLRFFLCFLLFFLYFDGLLSCLLCCLAFFLCFLLCKFCFLENYFLRNCAKLSQSIARYNFLRIVFVRLRELVVALCFLAVFIDTLAKLEADYTTLETLQKLGFLRMIALKSLQKLGFLRMIALKTLQKLET